MLVICQCVTLVIVIKIKQSNDSLKKRLASQLKGNKKLIEFL